MPQHPVPHTMGQQFGRRSWAEPWKIKMVEPLRIVSREERQRALEEAGYKVESVTASQTGRPRGTVTGVRVPGLLLDGGTVTLDDTKAEGTIVGYRVKATATFEGEALRKSCSCASVSSPLSTRWV